MPRLEHRREGSHLRRRMRLIYCREFEERHHHSLRDYAPMQGNAVRLFARQQRAIFALMKARFVSRNLQRSVNRIGYLNNRHPSKDSDFQVQGRLLYDSQLEVSSLFSYRGTC